MIKEEIKLMNDFRIRLIADVVTGKFDVRSATASLPNLTTGDMEVATPDAYRSFATPDLDAGYAGTAESEA